MSEHLIAEEANVEAKFGSTPAIAANLKERLQAVKSRVKSRYYDAEIWDSPNLPLLFMQEVKQAVREVISTQHPLISF